MVRESIEIKPIPPYGNTIVPYTRSQSEITDILKKYGCKGIRWTYIEGQEDVLEFMIEANIHGVQKQVAVKITPPHIEVTKRRNTTYGRANVKTTNINQEYRLLFHYIKSKIESVVWGLSSVEREFLSDITMKLPNGRSSTVGEIVMGLVSEDRLQSLPFIDQKKEPPRNVTQEKVVDA